MSCHYYKKSVYPDRILAQIVKVIKIESIPQAENIELAFILGWQCVVKKKEFKEGELAIYFSIDSILDPENENSKFLEGRRLKTRKILNTLSQGLLAPTSWLDSYSYKEKINEGDDVTQIMKVKKFVFNEEIVTYTDDNRKNPFPKGVPKTDEERLQNIPRVLKNLPGRKVVITRKEDGTSATYVNFNETFLVCGRNFTLIDDCIYNKPYFEIEKKFNIGEKMKELGMNIAIQGEIVGPKIGGNKLKLSEYDFRVFNIWNIDDQYYLEWEKVCEITQKLNLNTVPLIYNGEFKSEWTSIKNLLEIAENLEYQPGSPAEGMVIKTNYGKENIRNSFKVISNKFLLKYGH